MILSKKAQAIAPSATLAIDSKAKAMLAEGKSVIGFGAGEPDFDTPSYIRDAAKAALDAGYTRYTPAAGLPALRRTICDELRTRKGLEYQPKQIIISNGAKHSLYNTFQCILNPGDEVIIPAPYWVSYPEIVKMADGVPVFVNTREEDGFLLQEDSLLQAITSRTKAICICNPCNPTGAFMERTKLEMIARIAIDHNLLVVADEVYEKLVYSDNPVVSIATLPAMQERTIIINGASKTYAMTGWRIGYAAVPAPLATVMDAMQSQSTSGPNTMAQHAYMAALIGPQEESESMREVFKERRDLIYSLTLDTPYISSIEPEGAFYLMVNVSELLCRKYKEVRIQSAEQLCSLMLENKGVAAVPGESFGAPHHIRLSYAISDENIREGMRRIKTFIRETEA
ncbi:MAG: pyridoxal phosphate-dependent aminotransferase [Christensenellales bacterium]|jgi:aspartate aminotransferase